MKWYRDSIQISTRGKGLYLFTDQVQAHLRKWDVQDGMCWLYLQHTSASLVISESYDPSARIDLETFMERIAPESQTWHCHTLEGPDDSPSHMRSMITQTSLAIPVDAGSLSLGTWQGVYLFEHRAHAHKRRVLVRCLSIDEPEA